MPNHSSNFVQACDVKNDDMNVEKNDNENNNDKSDDEDGLQDMVNLIDVQPHKGQTTLLSDITFTHIDVSIHAPDGALYRMYQ